MRTVNAVADKQCWRLRSSGQTPLLERRAASPWICDRRAHIKGLAARSDPAADKLNATGRAHHSAAGNGEDVSAPEAEHTRRSSGGLTGGRPAPRHAVADKKAEPA